ncbi:MAG: hypothetical protein M3P24_00800, partial [Gemmatimonadota bacterium]|nr:hypothetical protein [Gemmatimonadota bacterium]
MKHSQRLGRAWPAAVLLSPLMTAHAGAQQRDTAAARLRGTEQWKTVKQTYPPLAGQLSVEMPAMYLDHHFALQRPSPLNRASPLALSFYVPPRNLASCSPTASGWSSITKCRA